MLYLDRNMRHCLKAKLPLNIGGIDHVLHIALEWRAWFRDVPRLPDGEAIYKQWKMAIEPLLLHCPNIKSMSFVLPRVRHVGGVPSGREPYLAENYHCDLTPLPEDTEVPWGRLPVQIAGGVILGLPGTALSQIGGSSTPVEWRKIRRQMEAALCLLENGEVSDIADNSLYQKGTQRKTLRINGWWLVRPGAPTNLEQQDIQEFWH